VVLAVEGMYAGAIPKPEKFIEVFNRAMTELAEHGLNPSDERRTTMIEATVRIMQVAGASSRKMF
jgi:hypothetical protein